MSGVVEAVEFEMPDVPGWSVDQELGQIVIPRTMLNAHDWPHGVMNGFRD